MVRSLIAVIVLVNLLKLYTVGDPWWPQGLNGPFLNVGLQRWQDIRTKWTTPSRKRLVFERFIPYRTSIYISLYHL
jgi:hypothetical protein